MATPNNYRKSEWMSTDLNQRAEELQREIERLETTLGPDVDPELIVHGHIKRLHAYNEAKDAAQALMGKLAVLQGMTVRQMHTNYDLSPED